MDINKDKIDLFIRNNKMNKFPKWFAYLLVAMAIFWSTACIIILFVLLGG